MELELEQIAQKRAEEHLAKCQEAMWDENGDESDGAESPASAPFCGCETCIVREVLYVSWATLQELVENDRRRALERVRLMIREIDLIAGAALSVREVGAEEHGDPESESDGEEHRVLKSEVHLASVPPPPDGEA